MPSDMLSLFADPPKSYRIQPFWFLNLDFNEAELRRQIAEMDEKGVGGAVLHCRHGLTVEYMSSEWLDMIGVCIDELKKRGMEAWLYDEDDWPSGTVGGKLTRAHPEYRMRYLRIQELRVQGGATWKTTLKTDDNTVLCVQAHRIEPGEGKVVFTGEVRDITDRVSGDKLQWEAPPGHWLVAVFWICPVAERVTWDRAYYLDTMNPEAVNLFKQMAYEPYLRFEQEFGRTIKGIFTDEPGLMIHDGYFGVTAMRTTVQDPQGTLPGTVIAWSHDFLNRFRELKGYDLKPKLLALLYDLGPDTRKIRCDYYDALVTWYIEAYHGNLSGWAEEHGLEYIGHTLEDPLWGAVRSQGNQLRVLETFSRPGLDYLGHGVGTRDNPFRILASKCGASVAHVQGKARVMCESFGGSGHGHTMAQRRLDANFMACLGVNMFIPHAFYYSFKGFRKTDWPPTEFYHSPFWPWYKPWADYLARLSLVQSTGTLVTDACILQPLLTVQMDLFREGQSDRNPPAQQLFNQISDLMLRLHHDYDYVDDSQLAQAKVNAGCVVFEGSRARYPLLVLPGCRVMSLEAARFIQQYFEAGGKIIAIGELPSECTDPAGDEPLRDMMAGVFGDVESGAGRNQSANGGVAVARVDPGDDLQLWLLQTVPQLVSPDVIIDDADRMPVEDLICSHRVDGVRHTFLLVNRGNEDIQGTLRTPLEGLVQEWSLESGATRHLPVGKRKDGRLCIPISLGPADARLVVIQTDQILPEGLVAPPEPELVDEIRLAPQWDLSVGDENVLILDRWDYTARDIEAQQKHHVGCPGQANTYKTAFEITSLPHTAKLVLDDVEQNIPSHVGFLSRTRNMEVFVNGKPAPPLEPSTWQDRYFAQTDIRDLLQVGTNTLEVHVISLLEPFQHLNEPVYLVGGFGVMDGTVTALPEQVHGPFNEQGFPHFVGIAAHRQTVEIPAQYATGHRLVLDPGEIDDCCRVIVNGQEVAIRLWPPFTVDITKALQAGANELVVEVANSLTNLYNKESRRSGISGPGCIRVYKA